MTRPPTVRSVAGLAASVVVCAMGLAPVAHASDEVAVNGTYTAFSDGRWAQTDQSYHDEASVTQTWTITSTCATYQDCTGHVTERPGLECGPGLPQRPVESQSHR